jgi:hypothetical protein
MKKMKLRQSFNSAVSGGVGSGVVAVAPVFGAREDQA